jgi:hypothetical protein
MEGIDMAKQDAAGDLYSEDFFAWTVAQAGLLKEMMRERLNTPLDLPHLVEEIADLGKSERDAVRSQLRRIIEHCLKLEFSAAESPRNDWKASIDDARLVLADKMSRSLRRDAEEHLAILYEQARRQAARSLLRFEGAVPPLPETCPYSLDALAAEGSYPKNRLGLIDPEAAG